MAKVNQNQAIKYRRCAFDALSLAGKRHVNKSRTIASRSLFRCFESIERRICARARVILPACKSPSRATTFRFPSRRMVDDIHGRFVRERDLCESKIKFDKRNAAKPRFARAFCPVLSFVVIQFTDDVARAIFFVWIQLGCNLQSGSAR